MSSRSEVVGVGISTGEFWGHSSAHKGEPNSDGVDTGPPAALVPPAAPARAPHASRLHSLGRPSIYSFIYPFIHVGCWAPFICLFIHPPCPLPFLHSFIPAACVVHSFIHARHLPVFIHSFIHASCTAPFIHSSCTHHPPCPSCAGPLLVVGTLLAENSGWQGLVGRAQDTWGPAPAE